MPPIAKINGIAIQMHYRDHNPPHFHVRSGSEKALVRLSDGEIIAGKLSPRIARRVREWVVSYKRELQKNWERARARQPLLKIGMSNVGS